MKIHHFHNQSKKMIYEKRLLSVKMFIDDEKTTMDYE